MKHIVELLEAAKIPDRSLDWEIHLRHGIEGAGAYGDHPRYTHSLDDALKLVPAKLGWNLQGNTNIFYGVVAGHNSKACRTPAIALCAAALMAEGCK